MFFALRPSCSSLCQLVSGLSVLSLALLANRAAAGPTTDQQIDFFEKRIRPVLVKDCYSCHSATAKKVRGGLLLDTRDGIRKGGGTGPAVVPGDPRASLLVKAICDREPAMPPAGPLPANVVADFITWIQQGALDPREARAGIRDPRDTPSAKEHWAFRPPKAAPAPAIQTPTWPLRRLDRFILAGLEAARLEPAPPADRRTWLRRVTFDLIGLPPTPAEVDRFLADSAPDAYERQVDRLLASPRFGERWARMWLDVARYGEDQAHIVGDDRSLCYPNAYLYRDWVIKSLNADMPYDRFVQLQLAADLTEPASSPQIAALGFLGLGPKYYDRKSPAVMADEWEDRVDVVSRGLLGLTVACARCHDHKYDPIHTADYYALAGVFASTRMYNRPLNDKCERKGDGEAKRPTDAMHIVCEGKPTDLHVLLRGDINTPGPVAPRHFLPILCTGTVTPWQQGSGRKELALAITSRTNPLTARVIVNRVWGQIFGRPIVGTPSNFGTLGERPTHAGLLDDLAIRFMDAGWSLKWLMKEMVLSATYRQRSQGGARGQQRDPDNRLLAHMNRRRLSVEAWRDAILIATGRLAPTIGGPSIEPNDPQGKRRTIYSQVSRLSLNPLLALFDFPDPNIHADRRTETTTPLQKLFVMNSPFMLAQAQAFVNRLQAADPAGTQTDRGFIEQAYRVLFDREVSPTELTLALRYLRSIPERRQSYAQVLLASNEFLFVD